MASVSTAGRGGSDAGAIADASTRHYDKPASGGSPLTPAGWVQKITDKPGMAAMGN